MTDTNNTQTLELSCIECLEESLIEAPEIFFTCPDCGMEQRIPAWELGYGIPDLIDDLLEWGNGSGEEIFDYLTGQGNLTTEEAKLVIQLLSKK